MAWIGSDFGSVLGDYPCCAGIRLGIIFRYWEQTGELGGKCRECARKSFHWIGKTSALMKLRTSTDVG